MAQSSIIGWNLPNGVTFLFLIVVIWFLLNLASHFARKASGSSSSSSTIASTAPQAAGSAVGGSATLSLVV